MDQSTQESLLQLGVSVPEVLLPSEQIDLKKWAVIACDQHTSEPAYWQQVDREVGPSPSTLRVVYPEVYLGEPDASRRIDDIHTTMRSYLDDGVLRSIGAGMVLTVRSTPHVDRRLGLVLALDLDRYDYTPGANSLIRASEATIVDRLPPRVRIRSGAPIELPHVLVLVDDAANALFGGLNPNRLPHLYTTELMLGGGSVSGYHVKGEHLSHVAHALHELAHAHGGSRPFLFAVGDGNHSLATAKSVWEALKGAAASIPSDSPARYALVEVVNLYDPGLRFEPIHRFVRFPREGVTPDAFIDELASRLGADRLEHGVSQMREMVTGSGGIGYVAAGASGVLSTPPSGELSVALLQSCLDSFEELDLDYIHGWDTAVDLGRSGGTALLLPPFDPSLLFDTVSSKGVLPRKAFSLGEAEEKRYYLEARRIV